MQQAINGRGIVSPQVASQPYTWPYDGPVVPRRTALLVCADGDALSQIDEQKQGLLDSIVEAARDAGVAVIASAGPGLAPQLVARCQADICVERPGFGAFTATPLESVLRTHGWSDLVLVGFPFELGADCTMREANDLGFECLAIEDCGSGLSPSTLAGALDSIRMSGGIFGATAKAEAFIAALQADTCTETERNEP